MSERAGVGVDPMEAVAGLEAELASISPRSRPYQHAIAAYRLGLAYAEAPSGDHAANLRRALGCYDVAAKGLDPRFDPVEHARVLNAAGAARRQLGEGHEAARLFKEAVALLTGRGRDSELAAVLNNLGLALTELGRPDEGAGAFDLALPLFDRDSAEGRRAWAATMQNRGLALASTGKVEGLEAAIADYRAALAGCTVEEAPYHHGLVFHSIGVASTSLAELVPARRQDWLQDALEAFSESLAFFSSSGFPFQHAMAKFNQGVAFAAVGGHDDLRRAMACFEDALAIFDPRLHPDPWRQAYERLRDVEGRLARVAPGATRADHFAALAWRSGEEERRRLLRERLLRLVALPGPRRAEELAEWGRAVAQLPTAQARQVIEAELEVLMEVPNDALEALLTGHVQANQALPPECQEDADRALDEAVGWALNGPQRVFVRDFLYSLGFERP